MDEYRCQVCNSPIRWVVTDKGRRIPVNFDPDSKRGSFAFRVIRLKSGQTRRVAMKLSRVEQLQALEDGEELFALHRPVCGLKPSGGRARLSPELRHRASQSIAAGKERFR